MRTKIIFLIMLPTFFCACNEAQKLETKDGFAVITAAKNGEAVATYAGGCFWAMQECMLELKGVSKVISGYSGGTKANPDYNEVLSKATGYAEAVQVYYDPKVISFEKLTEAFFNAHDPTQEDGQGPDLGSDYRSIAFYRSPSEKVTIQKWISRIDSINGYNRPVVTEVVPFKIIYPAETEHQDYYRRRSWDPYIRNVSRPKVLKLRKTMPYLIKSEYKD
ncbi:peptide-methionine (S)-S-oxide reductase [Pedobacter ginsengisoli]|uniref:Peptide methionine sulfoxide reductase MsrA n=1 Tax=Pedobacter ginsengisoli TaxID=363852 RepID=A0A2D1U6K3_9SPHI|nr:peptide-methionine (S)-S-oxide reductase MsrA [Pedobacter ginsengisoli]ATP57236.1 peptide-methionine (S)-S-oxide reductase [Pedobacter ginsengisoli]